MLFHCLEEECKDFDVMFAEADASDAGSTGDFAEVVEQQQRKRSLVEQAAHADERSSTIVQQLAWLMVNSDGEEANAAGQAAANVLQLTATQLQQDADVLRQQAAEIILPISIANGPCTRLLDDILQEHGIDRQRYHGGTFQGDHVHSALKVKEKKKILCLKHDTVRP